MGNTPNIRFKGFTDDWEQRKLSECAGFRRGSFPQPYGNKEWYDGEGAMPFVQVADVADDMKLVDDTKQKISKLAQPMSVYADKGSVLVTLQGSIGRVAITQYGAFVDRTVLIFDKYNQDIDKTFWAYIIKEKFIDEARKAPGGTIKTITKEALSDFDLMLPNYDEQKKLGAFLVSIDNLITLHQRKCDETKKLKKFMLQKMFPKKNEKKPEIRFAGFTDDWEQRKLIDYLEVSSEKNRDNRFTKDDVLSVSGEYGIVNQIEFQGRSFAGASVSNYGVVENGDVVYTKSPLKSNPYGIIKTNKGIPGIVSTLYAVYKPKEITDSKFVQIYFELDSRMNSYMHPLVNKGAKNDMKVSAENALKGMVSFPKKDEQEMISLYFSSLDNLIALHQRKCDEIKEIKKFMLQNMFPQKG